MVASLGMDFTFIRERKFNMAYKKSYWYLFLDGYRIKSASMTGGKLLILEHEHGKLVRKERYTN